MRFVIIFNFYLQNRFIQFFHGIPNENDFERESRSHIDVAILLDVKEAMRGNLTKVLCLFPLFYAAENELF